MMYVVVGGIGLVIGGVVGGTAMAYYMGKGLFG